MSNSADEICGNCGKRRADPSMIFNDACPKFKPTGIYMKKEFEVKDSGKREEFSGGMVRDTQENKIDYSRALDGPMFKRWAEHLTKGCEKYPDVEPGVPNWKLAKGQAEYVRFRKSALRHFIQWYNGDTDEDHAAAVFFNINGAEYLKAQKVKESQQASVGAVVDLRETWVPGATLELKTGDKDK